MPEISQNIKEILFRILSGEMLIEEFENWVYSLNELEDNLNSGDYFDLISFDYKKQGAIYEVQNLIRHFIDPSEFELWKIRNLLADALNRTGDYTSAIRKFYDLYCHGYEFMDNLGLDYGLSLDCPSGLCGVDNFEDLSNEQKDKIANSFYPEIKAEIHKVLDWIDSGLILLTGNKDEYDRYEYLDNRSESDA
jgi:hypothetical protein